jgi:hydroxymethylbilane synthase
VTTLPIRLATRGSGLALWQAEWVRRQLWDRGLRSELVVVRTRGDAEHDRPLHNLEGKGFFTKEIEDAVLEGRADVAVHSLKDLPTTLPPGLELGAVPRRGDPRDCLVTRQSGIRSLADLPAGSRIGTSSLRRSAQLRALRPDVEPASIRGNVPTRIDKVMAGEYDGAMLAVAGLERLGLAARAAFTLDPHDVMPAPGQGALALEIRTGDARTAGDIAALDDAATRARVAAERAVLAELEGGCRAPIAAYAGETELRARVIAVDGSSMVESARPLDLRDPVGTALQVSRDLRARGAEQLIHAARES